MASLNTVCVEPQGGFEPADLAITNRLRYHCATGADAAPALSTTARSLFR